MASPPEMRETAPEMDQPVDELQQKIRELNAVNAVGRALTASLDLQQVLRTIMEHLNDLLRPRQYSLLLLDEHTGELVFHLAVGEGAERLPGLRLAPGEGIAGWVTTHCQSLLVADVRRDPRFASRFDAVSQSTTQAVLAVPLVFHGRPVGVIELVNALEDRPFQAEDLQLVQMLAEFAAIAIANARTYRRLEELTIVDEHTGLYNARHLRRVLEVEAERGRRFHHPFSVIFLDLDRFKQVNDTWGHAMGSLLLARVGELLQNCLRRVDVPTRYGGDEFVLVLPETGRDAAIDVARRIADSLRTADLLADKGIEARVSGSFGVATFPDDGTSGEELLAAADSAMYRVKATGRDGVQSASG